MRNSLFLPATVALLMIVQGCTKEFHIDTGSESLYVIEGRISNMKGPYYIRITKSFSDFKNQDGTDIISGDYVEPEAVTDALVIISDDMGVRDTLVPAIDYDYKNYRYVWDAGSHKFDSAVPRVNTFLSAGRGYYETTKITGVPGHTYHLQVRIGNKEFHASAYMPFVPALDSAKIEEVEIPSTGDKGFMPVVYFNEPQQEKNYYLLQHNHVDNYMYDQPVLNSFPSSFQYHVVDDAILPPYVNGIPIRILTSGHNPCCYFYFTLLTPRFAVQARLSSITRESYEYFKVLSEQLTTDGNVYKPVPTTPPGNISGGALGLFYATHVSYKLYLP
jgi:hypothetical protein